MASPGEGAGRLVARFDETVASAALVLMAVIPLLEIILRPAFGRGVDNSAVLVQHLGLVLAMFGAVVLARRQIELGDDERRKAAGMGSMVLDVPETERGGA